MPNQYDMSWGDISDSKKSADFIKVEANRTGTRMRLASAPSQLYTHWGKHNGKSRKVICPGASCPLCEAGVDTSTRYQCLVIDKTASEYSDANGYVDGPKVKVFETGISVIRMIKELANEPMYGNPMNYDIIIKKEGAQRETKYSVIPTPVKSEFTAAEKEAIKNATPIRELSKAHTREEILAMDLDELRTADEPQGESA